MVGVAVGAAEKDEKVEKAEKAEKVDLRDGFGVRNRFGYSG